MRSKLLSLSMERKTIAAVSTIAVAASALTPMAAHASAWQTTTTTGGSNTASISVLEGSDLNILWDSTLGLGWLDLDVEGLDVVTDVTADTGTDGISANVGNTSVSINSSGISASVGGQDAVANVSLGGVSGNTSTVDSGGLDINTDLGLGIDVNLGGEGGLLNIGL